MTHETFWLKANDRTGLFVNQWLPAGKPKAIILVAHGMAEHSGRYARLGKALCEAGFGVYATTSAATAEPPNAGHWAITRTTMLVRGGQ